MPQWEGGATYDQIWQKKRLQRSAGTNQLSRYTVSSEAATRFQGYGQRSMARYSNSTEITLSLVILKKFERFPYLEGGSAGRLVSPP